MTRIQVNNYNEAAENLKAVYQVRSYALATQAELSYKFKSSVLSVLLSEKHGLNLAFLKDCGVDCSITESDLETFGLAENAFDFIDWLKDDKVKVKVLLCFFKHLGKVQRTILESCVATGADPDVAINMSVSEYLEEYSVKLSENNLKVIEQDVFRAKAELIKGLYSILISKKVKYDREGETQIFTMDILTSRGFIFDFSFDSVLSTRVDVAVREISDSNFTEDEKKVETVNCLNNFITQAVKSRLFSWVLARKLDMDTEEYDFLLHAGCSPVFVPPTTPPAPDKPAPAPAPDPEPKPETDPVETDPDPDPDPEHVEPADPEPVLKSKSKSKSKKKSKTKYVSKHKRMGDCEEVHAQA